MGERGKRVLRVKFDGKLMLEFHGTTISSDAGLLVYRELDEALGLTAELENVIQVNKGGHIHVQAEATQKKLGRAF